VFLLRDPYLNLKRNHVCLLSYPIQLSRNRLSSKGRLVCQNPSVRVKRNPSDVRTDFAWCGRCRNEVLNDRCCCGGADSRGAFRFRQPLFARVPHNFDRVRRIPLFRVCRARFSVGRERANRLSVQRIPTSPESLSAAVFACCSWRLLAALLVTTRFSKTASRVGTRHNPAPIDPIPQSCDFLSRSPRRAGRVRGLHGAGAGTLESGWFSRTAEDYFPLRDAR
jgi:hypothetical protein